MLTFVCLIAGSAACAGTAPGVHEAGPGELPARFHYDVRVEPSLEDMSVTLCFRGPTPRELAPGKAEAASALVRAHWEGPGARERLPIVNGRVRLGERPPGGCVSYQVLLRPRMGLDLLVTRRGASVLASTNLWLLRPPTRAPAARASLCFELAEGIRVALPWPSHAGRYELDESAFRFDSQVAIGKLRTLDTVAVGVPLHAVVLDGELALSQEALARWLVRAVEIAAGLDGHFPASTAHVVIVPEASRAEPVPFGMVTRGGVGAVTLFVAVDAREDALVADWVLPHEWSHLRLPFVRRADAWLPEGLATYYQEVLRARAGLSSPEQTLRGLVYAIGSAALQGTGRVLSAESEAMHATHAYRAVYWAGAAFFLIADVELRVRTQGQRSLDSALTCLAASAQTGKVYDAVELLGELDRCAGITVFVPLWQAASQRAFPELGPALSALGVEGDALRDDASAVALRESIFARPAKAQR